MADESVDFQTTTPVFPPDDLKVATDTIGGVAYQKVKIDVGGDGALSPLVRGQQADANSLPVTLSTEQAAFLNGLETLLAAIQTATEAAQAALEATLAVSGTVTIQDGGNTITVDGTVAVTHAALTELAAAIDTELQVDIVAALPAGNNNIGDVDAIQSGTWTVELGATDNAVLDSIDADLTTIIGHVDGIEGHVDGIEGLLTTIDADTGNIATAVARIEDVVIDVDGAAGATPAVALIGAIRDDALTTLTPVEGDAIALRVDEEGKLWVNAGTVTASADSEHADDADFTDGTTIGVPSMGVYEGTPSTVTDGDMGIVGITEDRALRVNVDNAGDIGGGTQYTEADTDASITGVAVLMEGAADALVPLQGTAAAGLLVNLGANNDVTVTGTVDLGATDNAVLDNIDADLTTIIGHVDGIEGILTTIDADTGSILTAVQLIDDAIFVDDTATHSTGTTKGMGIMAVAVPTDTSISANDIGMVGMTTDRRQYVEATIAATQTLSTVTTVGTVSALGTGTTGPQKAEDVAHNTGDMGLYMLAVRDDTLGAHSQSDNDYESLHTNASGALWVTLTPNTTGGATTMNASSSDGGTALTSTAQAIKASAGTLKGYYIYNPNASAQFVQFYNTASGSVTVGTTNPLFMLTIPATSGANLWMPDGINFGTAISWAATSTAGGNGAPSTALDAVAWYV